MKILFFITLSFIAIASLNNQHVFADEYIKVIKESVNIRFKPNTNSIIVAKGKKGDVFNLVELRGQWYVIFMFSGEYRYINKSLANRTVDAPKLSTSIKNRKNAFREIIKAEKRAKNESEIRYPSDIYKQIDLQRILSDRYILPILQKYAIPSARYIKLIAEGVKSGW